jgi:hypothetical protein
MFCKATILTKQTRKLKMANAKIIQPDAKYRNGLFILTGKIPLASVQQHG